MLASGGGSNFRNLHRHLQESGLKGQIVLLISDRSGSGAADDAEDNGIPVAVIPPKAYPTTANFGEALLSSLQAHSTDLVVLAGYLKKIPVNVVEKYANRILNIHPSLLPAFGGKGMYGLRVHQAVFNAGVHFSGATVHLVNNEYDAGPVLLQQAVNIRDCNSPEEIARRVLAEEHRLFPKALDIMLDHEISIEGSRVKIKENIQ